MIFTKHIFSFAKKYPIVGPIAWILSSQFFIVQAIAISAWENPLYSSHSNAISDLGAISCGMFDGRFVCSPLNVLMNGSLIFLGLTMIVGSVLLYARLRKSKVGFAMMILAGLGAALVGFFPEDTIYWAHLVGQDLAFLLGNIALIVFGFTLRVPTWFRWYSVASGMVALTALVLFLTHNRFFLGLGGMERLVAYPLLLWLIVFGVYMVIQHLRRR